jgi:cysteine desulfurase
MTTPSPCYLDHAATTPLAPQALEAMVAVLSGPAGNASAVHQAGVAAARVVERSRFLIARRLACEPEGLIFTGGGTEANNLAIKGVALRGGRCAGHLICSAIEHPSVMKPMRWLAARGFEHSVLPVDSEGRVDPAQLQRSLRPDTVLVSIIHGSNELGTVQPLDDLGRICRDAGVPLHSDACQSFTKLPLSLAELPIDLLSINAHKIHGPHGVGALWRRPGLDLEAQAHGGGQEGGLRSGTINTAGIAGFGAAVAAFDAAQLEALAARRKQLVQGLVARFPTARFNGPRRGVLPHITSVRFPGCDGKALFLRLNRAGFLLSVGSACHATATTPSPVLLAAGLGPAAALSTLRISHGHDTSEQQIEELLEALEAILPDLRGSA